ncbi:hypothetical protein [Mycobacterium sp. DL592]|uniref:hypothetical protein n=1 Tax=Mycobacterium sp. DL592 TaxID=2675524 RepID=UPI001424936A|nr:hypothetical protein [Mycobacterium sp. DL592]
MASPSAPLALSTAKYELTSISEITVQGINDAYWFGWGGFLTSTTPYYQSSSPIYVSGISGVLYYVIDCATSNTCTSSEGSSGLTLDNYFFEAGGLPAVLDVAANEVFGSGSVPALIADTVFKYGVTNVINSLLVSAAEALPTFNLGPITVGGGILTSLFFTGATPDGKFSYGTPGLSAVLSYIVTSISDALPSAAATTAAATKTATALSATATTDTTTGDAKSSADTTTEAATSTEATTKATGGFKKETEATTDSATTAAAATAVAPSTDTTSTDTTTTPSTGTTTSTDTTSSTDTSTLPKATPTVKAPKAATSENPLVKIGQKIADAISGKKESKSDSGSSSDSGSGGSGSTGGSAKS